MRWLALIIWLLAGTGEADSGSRARMGPGMEVARTPATLAAGRGEPMVLTGVVRTADWEPVPDATVTAWQANAKGRYGPNRRHQCCYLTATVRTDRNGRYALDTIVPSSYSGGEPHIHLEVQGAQVDEIVVDGRPERLVHDIVLP